jgi:hypothetical protein
MQLPAARKRAHGLLPLRDAPQRDAPMRSCRPSTGSAARCDASPAETDRYTCKWLLLYRCGLSLVYLLGRLASYKTSEFERAPTGICVHRDSPDCNLKLQAVRRQLERNLQCSTSDPGPSPAVAFAPTRNLGGLRTTRGHPAAVPAAPSPSAARPGVTVGAGAGEPAGPARKDERDHAGPSCRPDGGGRHPP